MPRAMRFCVILFFLLLVFPRRLPSQNANLLSGSFGPERLGSILLRPEKWHPYPRWSDHAAWSRLPESVRRAHIARAEKFLRGSWPLPKATDFLEFVRNGNRSRYEAISFGRRQQLATLVLAECMEGKGRFLDDIVNGVWAICEETYWGVPAHVGLQKKGPGLPDVTEPTVDLFAAETGMLIAWTYYLVGDQLDKISPLVTERMRYEVERRIISVNLDRSDFWWMGFDRIVNNWDPWICSNWLTAVLIFEQDSSRRVNSVHKILRCLDNFLNPYPRDGGCDEGPSYWSRAGGSLFDCLELFQSASNSTTNVFRTPLIQEIGKYIYRAYIHDRYFINFADAPAKQQADASLIFRYGKSIDDEMMMGFGAYLAKLQHLGEGSVKEQFGSLGRALPTLFDLDELAHAKPSEPLLRDVWLPDLQVMAARSSAGSMKGFYVAAKGGNNAESHNHNDVGNFIVYDDGQPVIIDVGVETYTAKTFSDDRYSIWTMQSAYHNLPTINEVMQKEGREYHATNVRHEADDETARLSLDIALAYPPEARVNTWVRLIELHRGKEVVVKDQYELQELSQPVVLSLMTVCHPSVSRAGSILLRRDGSGNDGRNVSLSYDESRFSASVEPIPIEDPRLKASWGNRIYRILLTSKSHALQDEYSITFSEQ
jgi:hypothetical protein